MNKIFLFCILMIGIANLGNSKNQNNLNQQTKIDKTSFVILKYDTTFNWLFDKAINLKLTNQNIEDIEKILNKSVDEYNIEQEKEFIKMKAEHPEYKLEKEDWLIDLKKYKRQYVAVINAFGEKEVWINCFCGGWGKRNICKTKVVIIDDGGHCFFNLKINLTKGVYYHFDVNGRA